MSSKNITKFKVNIIVIFYLRLFYLLDDFKKYPFYENK